MVKLILAKAIQPTPNSINVSWEYEASSENFALYVIDILRAEIPSDDISTYGVLNTTPLNAFTTHEYIDLEISTLTNKFSDYFYRIRVTNTLDPLDVLVSPAMNVTVKKDRVSAEIIRRKTVALTRFAGTDVLLLKRRTHGQTCSNCYDPILGRTTIANCLTCYGTGYEGGFYTPFPMKVQINEGSSRNQLSVFGEWQDNDAIITNLGNAFNPKDILCDKLGRRWVILNCRSTNHNLYVIAQQSQARQLDKVDIQNQFPLPNVLNL